MTERHDLARERLALLLAGGGSRCRRAVAAAGAGESPLAAARRAHLPAAFVDRLRAIRPETLDEVLARITDMRWRWVVPGEEQFPTRLEATADPPLGLFVRGQLSPAPTVAVVGSRQATAYGHQVARLLGEELAAAGVTVVSGMARGVDGAAHRGALDAGGRTVAVWGAGPDRVYPAEHRGLAGEIAATGTLVTEYPLGCPPRRRNFPERNRIIAGLVQAVVVVEAGARSGALGTARIAVDEGRDVLAVPGNIFSPLSVGPHALLRLGARPLVTSRDVLEAVGCHGLSFEPRDHSREPLLEHLLPGEALTPDELAQRSGERPEMLLPRLLELELAGRVELAPDGRYRRLTVAPAADSRGHES